MAGVGVLMRVGGWVVRVRTGGAVMGGRDATLSTRVTVPDTQKAYYPSEPGPALQRAGPGRGAGQAAPSRTPGTARGAARARRVGGRAPRPASLRRCGRGETGSSITQAWCLENTLVS
ncbi:hypothetical protein E2C01_055323 [Portunus trituberculatus]|uniref:Uncharacterized protein n=1 Tax=Portunus trituberculatus TaxID=210409 RepID=A0A5B7GUZ1_PORTR|nr:hypothetical protein [Portunus trituberculatus]